MTTLNAKYTYFAADSTDKLIDEINKRMLMWGHGQANTSLIGAVMRAVWRNTAFYYSAMLEPASWDTGLNFEGEKGELLKVVIPKARQLVRQYVSLATKQRYSFDVVTDCTESDPIVTARLGNAIVKYETENHSLDMLADKVTEMCLVEGFCFVANTWNTGKGSLWARASETDLLYTGGNEVETFSIGDVCFDWTKKTQKDVPWITLRRKRNRWDLIAQFPELEEEIRSAPTAYSERQTVPSASFDQVDEGQEDIYVREFYHRPTAALPHGRMCVWATPDAIFYDDVNPYEDLPGVFFSFGTIRQTMLGYPMFCNLIAPQEIFDKEISTVVTNHAAFGVQSVLVPRGSNISPNQVSKGLSFIDYTPQNAEGGGKPEPMQMTATPPEVFNFINTTSSILEELSGINATLRGQPPASVTSGAMAATLSANALEFIYSDTKGLSIGLEKLMSLSLYNYKHFATVEQVIDVVGEGNISYAQNFKAADIMAVKKAKIRQGNPLLNTIAGRLQVAESLLPLIQAGNNDAVSQYMGILSGEPIETLFEALFSENVAVQQELESLQRGETVQPIITDQHPRYMRAYQKLLYSQAVRKNSPLVQPLLALLMERHQMEQQCPPDLKAILRNQPLPVGMPMGVQANGGAPPPAGPEQPPSAGVAREPVTAPSEQAAPAAPQI